MPVSSWKNWAAAIERLTLRHHRSHPTAAHQGSFCLVVLPPMFAERTSANHSGHLGCCLMRRVSAFRFRPPDAAASMTAIRPPQPLSEPGFRS